MKKELYERERERECVCVSFVVCSIPLECFYFRNLFLMSCECVMCVCGERERERADSRESVCKERERESTFNIYNLNGHVLIELLLFDGQPPLLFLLHALFA